MLTALKSRIQITSYVVLAGMTTVLLSCSRMDSHKPPSSIPVPVSDFKRVAGKWEGMAKKMPSMQDDGWVILNIQEKGTFTFSDTRLTSLLVGAGILTLSDGRLTSQTENRSATFALHDRGGQPVLVGEATGKDGDRYHVELTRVK